MIFWNKSIYLCCIQLYSWKFGSSFIFWYYTEVGTETQLFYESETGMCCYCFYQSIPDVIWYYWVYNCCLAINHWPILRICTFYFSYIHICVLAYSQCPKCIACTIVGHSVLWLMTEEDKCDVGFESQTLLLGPRVALYFIF